MCALSCRGWSSGDEGVAVLDLDEPRPGEQSGEPPPVLGRHHPVLGGPHDERGPVEVAQLPRPAPRGRVALLVPFGVMVEVAEGVEGLVRPNDPGRAPVADPAGVVQVGDEVTVVVVEVDRERRGLVLSWGQGRTAPPP